MDIQFPSALHSRAFTLIELIAVLAMVSIVLAIGVPGIRSLAGNSRITAIANNMLHQLHYARSEAVRQSTPVVLCPSQSGSSCDDSFHWENGFILFSDHNGDRNPDSGEQVLRHFAPGDRHTRILTSPGRKKIIYQASGMSPGSTATITVCDRDARISPKAVILANPGRPRLSDSRADGAPLECI